MKRLDHDITLTMLNSIRFAVYFHNILSLKSMSWPEYNYYTEDRFRIHPLLLQLPPRERGTLFQDHGRFQS